jgi:hypothetical protein
MVENTKALLEREKEALLLRLEEINKSLKEQEVEGLEGDVLNERIANLVAYLNSNYFSKINKFLKVNAWDRQQFKIVSYDEDGQESILVSKSLANWLGVYKYCTYVKDNILNILDFLKVVDTLVETTLCSVITSTSLDSFNFKLDYADVSGLQYGEARLYRNGKHANLDLCVGVSVKNWDVESKVVGIVNRRHVEYSGYLEDTCWESSCGVESVDLVEHYTIKHNNLTDYDIEDLDDTVCELVTFVKAHSAAYRTVKE